MGMLPITIRKRTIYQQDLDDIQDTVNRHWNKGRTSISKILCREWNWRQPNGRMKDMACREVLLTLNRNGLLKLPPRKTSAHNEKRNQFIPVVDIDTAPLNAKLSCLASVELKSVRNSKLESLYNSLVQEHHYLAFRQIVGLRLRFQPVGLPGRRVEE